MGWTNNALEEITIPDSAGDDDPRVVISTNDPLAEQLSQDASITYYWADGRGFIQSVEASGGPDRGQWHFWGADENRLAQYIDIDFDHPDPTDDSITLRGGGAGTDATISLEGNGTGQLDSDNGFGLDGTLYRGSALGATDPAYLLINKATAAIGGSQALTTTPTLLGDCDYQPTLPAVSTGTYEWEAEVVCDFTSTVISAGVACVGQLFVNGVAASGSAAVATFTAAGQRGTYSMVYEGTTTDTTPLFEIRGSKTGAGGTYSVSGNTVLRVKIYA
jgi:hypothetical protein